MLPIMLFDILDCQLDMARLDYFALLYRIRILVPALHKQNVQDFGNERILPQIGQVRFVHRTRELPKQIVQLIKKLQTVKGVKSVTR